MVPGRTRLRLRGREDQLATISGLLARVRNGPGEVVVVEGAAGLGKTSLLAEAAAMATALGFHTGAGTADPGHSPVDMAALMQALLGGGPPLVERSALKSHAASREQRFWLLQDVQSLLEQAALRDPILICLDDLQWADAGTGFALRMLPQGLASLPVAWVVATRPDEGRTLVRRALDELADSGAGRIQLAPLGDSAVAEIAKDILGVPADGDLLRALARVEGNPFLLVDLIAGMSEEGLIATEAGRAVMVDDRLPHRVGDSVRRRLTRMTPTAERVATVSASLGRHFSIGAVAMLGGWSVLQLVQPVHELVQAGILTESGNSLAFQHDLVRDAVRMSVPSAVRRALDREAAEVLLASGALPVEVAAQLASSAEPGDEVAIRTLSEAAEALAIGDPSASADTAGAALGLAPERHPLRGPLVARRTVSLFAAGRFDEARTFADAVLRQTLPAEQEAQVHLGIASNFVLSADVRADHARQGLALPDTSEDLRARLLAHLFHNLMVAGRTDDALAVASQVEDGVRAGTDKAAVYAFEVGQSTIQYQLGHFVPSLDLLDEAERRRPGSVDDARERLAHNFRSWLLAALDRFDEAFACAEDGLAAAQRDRQNWAVHLYETWRGRHYLQLGQLDEAAAALEGRFRPSEAHLVVGVLDAASVVALGQVKLHQGEERAAGQVAEIAKVMVQTTAPAVRRLAAWYLARYAMSLGDVQEAHDWLCAMGKDERLSLFPLFPLETADDPQLVRIAVAAGDDELAGAVAQLALRRHEMNPDVATIEGVAAHAYGLLRGSAPDLERAVALLETGPRPMALASALEDLAVAHARGADAERAVVALDRALAINVRTSAVRDAARVRQRLRDLGVRRRISSLDRPTTGWESLTEAELRVAELVADGCTNRAIAQRLFVSPHTVNTHLRHVFDKLSIRSRVDLARVVDQHARGR